MTEFARLLARTVPLGGPRRLAFRPCPVLLAAMPPVPDQDRDERAEIDQGQDQARDTGRGHEAAPTGEQADAAGVCAIAVCFR